nr:hypothetical protein GCM10020063_020240 [Dactylosporangium thailandense]
MRTARQILADARTIAVVGASRDPLKAAYWVPKMLQEQGWRIIPINPHADRILGEHVYGRLADVPWRIDVVNVFRPAAEAPQIVREVAAFGARAVWLQLGIESPEARRIAEAAGLEYVEDTCIGMERTLAQMVVGGITPASRVYHGIDPEPVPAGPARSGMHDGIAQTLLRRRGGHRNAHRRAQQRQVRWRTHPAHNADRRGASHGG